MPRDEYAKNLMSGVTGSFSSYTLITYRMHIRGQSFYFFSFVFHFYLWQHSSLHFTVWSGDIRVGS